MEHDTKTSSVSLRRSEYELLLELVGKEFTSTSDSEKARKLSDLYNKLYNAKRGL